MAKILVVDDEEGVREYLAEALELDGHDVSRAEDGRRALALVEARGFDAVLTDLKMPAVTGMELLRRLRSTQPDVEVIVLTAHGTVETAVEAMKLGAFDYLEKPIGSPAELRLVVRRALERRALVAVRDRAARDAGGARPLTWGDPAMEPVVSALRKVAPTEATVLLVGDSGTGKEVAARALHAWSARAAGPFAAVNCAALTDTLLESELFGHEKGAFTGAGERRRGRLELAAGGTFFLDEVAELKPELQAKLLRVLQEKRFERVGGTQTLEANVRWVAATNRDLAEMMRAGRFRDDLYHRLAVFPVRLPPLCERKRDLAPLADALLADIGADLGRPGLALSEDARARLAAYDFPGNIRELRNVLERAAILADDRVVLADNLVVDPNLAANAERAGADPIAADGPLADIERAAIARALAASGGNRRRAAEKLEIGLRTLYDKIKRYGL